jgi:hypothetical protein
MLNRLKATLASFALLAGAVTAEAQSTTGLFLGVQYAGSSLSIKSAVEDLDFRGGFGLHAGIGLSDTWSVLANFDRSALTGSTTGTDVVLTQYDALLRMNMFSAAGGTLRVFLTGGATARTANAGRNFEQIAPTAGGGVHVFVIPKIAVNGTALWTFGKLTQASQLTASQNGQFEPTGVRVQAGASLYLFSH